MGQNQSGEVNNKTFYLSPPTEQVEIISESNPNTECQDTTNEQEQELAVPKKEYVYYQDEYLNNSPLFTFISGFYQDKHIPRHIFYKLSHDDVCRIAEYSKNWKVIPYTGNPNEKGIINWIGCLNESHQYHNPLKENMIQILTSHDYHVNYSRNECIHFDFYSNQVASVYRVFEYPSLLDKDCYFDPGCIIFYFPNHMIHPTGYSLRNGGGRGSVVRKWVLEAATAVNGPWIPLSCHPEDDTFFYDVTDGQNKENSFLAHCWTIPSTSTQKSFYSYFKLQSLHTHPNGRSHAFYISGFELFGTVRWNRK